MTELAQPDRQKKLDRMREEGLVPYPSRGVECTPAAELIASAGTAEEPGPMIGEIVTVAGRMRELRDFGKLIFTWSNDRSGRIQVGMQKKRLEEWWPSRKLLDSGDLVAFTGELAFTQKGEVTIWATEVKLQAKALAPPPEKWHGLADVEARYRRRYVDLWASDGVSEVFQQRSRIFSLTRRFLEDRAFLEVETPTLHPISGGATARPFVTHHNALDTDLYLRIAPELYLKRLIVGGLERVFEIARNFRNEGVSTRHNPEFTMLELYQAQANYNHMMELTEQLVSMLATELHGSTKLEFRGESYDLKAPFERRTYAELFKQHNGCDIEDRDAVRARAKELKLSPDLEKLGYWKLASEVFEESVEDHLHGPIFVTDYPLPICPLAKASETNPGYAERFELFIGGMELANAFSELNDPADQMARFEEQVASKDPETPGEVDIDYVQALEYGMPPTGGLGIGMDRLVMVLTGQDSIRDVLLFPALRQKSGD